MGDGRADLDRVQRHRGHRLRARRDRRNSGRACLDHVHCGNSCRDVGGEAEVVMMTTELRFLKFVEFIPYGCWNWTGALSTKGYGRFSFRGKNCFAHRVAYEIWIDKIPAGLFVCHRCDNPKCIRPSHLFLGDNSDNQQDAAKKVRHWQSKKTHCVNGHPFSKDNTYYRKSYKRGRICKTCANRQSKETYERTKS
jgi:hypothetical protein